MVYASATGNTELMAKAIVNTLRKHKYHVVSKIIDVDKISIGELLDYDAVLIGTYTWTDGELPFEMEKIYDELETIDISGRLFGVFGSGDSFYDIFCGAADVMAERLLELGGVVIPERLKVDLDPNREDIIRCKQFAEKLISRLETHHHAV